MKWVGMSYPELALAIGDVKGRESAEEKRRQSPEVDHASSSVLCLGDLISMNE